MPEGKDTDKVKFSMTIKSSTQEWLQETYPDADGEQEALRMAISDSRLLRDGLEITVTSEGD